VSLRSPEIVAWNKVRLGVEVLDRVLPSGVYRNSLIILAGPGGAGKSVLVAHMTKALMEREEPVIYVALDDDPRTVLQNYISFKIDVAQLIKRELLMIIDCFSYRLGHPRPAVNGVIREVEPDELERLPYTIIDVVLEKELRGRGLVVVDSLNELLLLYNEKTTVEVLRKLRALIAKGEGILVFATLHTSTDDQQKFLRSIEHLVDGVIEVWVTDETGPGDSAVRKLMVRKMKGVHHVSRPIRFYVDAEGPKLIE